jgi:hypothetical protein
MARASAILFCRSSSGDDGVTASTARSCLLSSCVRIGVARGRWPRLRSVIGACGLEAFRGRILRGGRIGVPESNSSIGQSGLASVWRSSEDSGDEDISSHVSVYRSPPRCGVVGESPASIRRRFEEPSSLKTGTAMICWGRTKSLLSRSGTLRASSLQVDAKRESVVKNDARGAGATSSEASAVSSWGH